MSDDPSGVQLWLSKVHQLLVYQCHQNGKAVIVAALPVDVIYHKVLSVDNVLRKRHYRSTSTVSWIAKSLNDE